MKWGKLFGQAITIAAPIVAGVVISPEAGVLVASGLGGGAVAKRAGQVVEKRTGRPVHKVGAPAAALGASFLMSQAIGPEAMNQICAFVQALCTNESATAVLPGVVAVLAHRIGSDIGKTVGR